MRPELNMYNTALGYTVFLELWPTRMHVPLAIFVGINSATARPRCGADKKMNCGSPGTKADRETATCDGGDDDGVVGRGVKRLVRAVLQNDDKGIEQFLSHNSHEANKILHGTFDILCTTRVGAPEDGKGQPSQLLEYYFSESACTLNRIIVCALARWELSPQLLSRLLNCGANDYVETHRRELPLSNETLRKVFDAAVQADTFLTRFGDTEITYACRVGHVSYLNRLKFAHSMKELRGLLTSHSFAMVEQMLASEFAADAETADEHLTAAALSAALAFMCRRCSSHNGNFPEHYAARGCWSQCLAWLSIYAQRNIFLSTNARGATVLHCLAEAGIRGHPQVCVCGTCDKMREAMQYCAYEGRSAINKRLTGAGRMTALQNALRVHNFAGAQILMQHGAAIFAKDLLFLLQHTLCRGEELSAHSLVNATMTRRSTDAMNDQLYVRATALLTVDLIRSRPDVAVRLALMFPRLADLVVGALTRAPPRSLVSTAAGAAAGPRATKRDSIVPLAEQVAATLRDHGEGTDLQTAIYLLQRLPVIVAQVYNVPSRNGRRMFCVANYKHPRDACVAITADRIAGLSIRTCLLRAVYANLTPHVAQVAAFVGGSRWADDMASIDPEVGTGARAALVVRSVVIAACAREAGSGARAGSPRSREGGGGKGDVGVGAGARVTRAPPHSSMCRLPWQVRRHVIMYYLGVWCPLFLRCYGDGESAQL